MSSGPLQTFPYCDKYPNKMSVGNGITAVGTTGWLKHIEVVVCPSVENKMYNCVCNHVQGEHVNSCGQRIELAFVCRHKSAPANSEIALPIWHMALVVLFCSSRDEPASATSN